MCKNRYYKFDITEEVHDRLAYLSEQKKNLEYMLGKLPEGNLLVAPGKTENSFRYYNRKSHKDKMGEYLGKDEQKLKVELAKRKYVAALLNNICDEMEKLKKIQKIQPRDSIIDTYTRMHPGVKKIINPIAVDDETYIRLWQSIPYEGLGFDDNDTTEFFSNKGERMRSKSEVAIANLLLLNNIPYKYECPIMRKNGGKLYPDFTILDMVRRRIIYWEHLGRMGDMSYVSQNIWKLEEYKKQGIYLGINLFITSESAIAPMGTFEPMQIIREILQK